MNRYTPYFENIEIPLKKGDTFYYGRFKNKTGIYDHHYFNDKGDLIVVLDSGKEIGGAKIRLVKESINFNIKFNLKDLGRDDWNKIFKDSDFMTKIEYMSPEEFLDRCDYKRYIFDIKKVSEIKKSIIKNTVLPIPSLWFDNESQKNSKFKKSNFHDGQHRVLALQELGVKKIPVMMVWNKESTLKEEHFSPFKAWYFPNEDKLVKFSPRQDHRAHVDNYVSAMKDGAVRIYAFDSQVEIETKDLPDNKIYLGVIKTLAKAISNFKTSIERIDWFASGHRRVFNMQEDCVNVLCESYIRNTKWKEVPMPLRFDIQYGVDNIITKSNLTKQQVQKIVNNQYKYGVPVIILDNEYYYFKIEDNRLFIGVSKDLHEGVIQEDLHLSDFSKHSGASDFTKDWVEIRRKIVGPGNKSSKIHSLKVNTKKDYITFVFKSKPSYKDNAVEVVDGKTLTFSTQKARVYTEEIRILDFFKLAETKPGYIKYEMTKEEIKEILEVASIQQFCNCGSFEMQGMNFISTLFNASIYPEFRAPQRWDKFHFNDNVTCKHISSILNSISFWLNPMTSMVNKYLKQHKPE